MPTIAQRDHLCDLVARGVPVKRAAHEAGVNYTTALPLVRGHRPPRFVPAMKTCAVCGASFSPRPNGRPDRWRMRTVCSNQCCGRSAKGLPKRRVK